MSKRLEVPVSMLGRKYTRYEKGRSHSLRGSSAPTTPMNIVINEDLDALLIDVGATIEVNIKKEKTEMK